MHTALTARLRLDARPARRPPPVPRLAARGPGTQARTWSAPRWGGVGSRSKGLARRGTRTHGCDEAGESEKSKAMPVSTRPHPTRPNQTRCGSARTKPHTCGREGTLTAAAGAGRPPRLDTGDARGRGSYARQEESDIRPHCAHAQPSHTGAVAASVAAAHCSAHLK